MTNDLAKRYPEELASINLEECRDWYSFGPRLGAMRAAFNFRTAEGVMTLVAIMRRRRFDFFAVFNGIYPPSGPKRPLAPELVERAEKSLREMKA